MNFHETSAGVVFGAVPGPQESTQDGPRSPQDGSKIVLDRFFRLLIFRFVFASFLVPFWCRFGLPNGPLGVRANYANRLWGGPRRSQDRLGSILLSSCRSGSLFWPSWGRFGLVLGSFWGALGVVLVLFRHFNSSIQPVNSLTRRFNSSTHRPMALRHFLTRPGGLRAARLN